MILCDARRLGRISRRLATAFPLCCFALAFTVGCKSGKPTEPAASTQQPSPVAAVQVPVSHQPLQAGTYEGRNSDGDVISVKLVKVGEQILVKSVGQKFVGSGVAVDAVTAKNGKPFGTYESDVLKFPMTFMVSFNPVNSITTDSGGSVKAASYDCTLLIRDSDSQPTFTASLAKGDNGFSPTFSDIEFSTPTSGFKMKDSYEVKLQKK